MNEKIIQIPLDQLQPHPDNRRVGGFDQGKLEQLAESIKAVGVQQPAVVRNVNEHYQIVAGERRWRASKIAGLETLPCVVRDLDDATVLRIQIIENLQREDVHPLDEAEGYARLIAAATYDVEAVAAEVGKSPSYVYQRLKLQELIEPVRKLLVDGTITAGHAIQVARLAPAQQEYAFKEFFLGGRSDDETPSVRELDEWIHNSILMELAKVSWKLDDAALLPAAGACATCPKRTGYQPQLFADVSKKDYCTDRACFQAKVEAVVQQKKDELAIAGTDHLLVKDGYDSSITKGVLSPYAWTECKKKDAGAVRVLVVGGANPGKLTWGKKVEKQDYAHGTSPEANAEWEKRKSELKVQQLARRALWDEVMLAVGDAMDSTQEELLRIAVTELIAGYNAQAIRKLVGIKDGEDARARIQKKGIIDGKDLVFLLLQYALLGERDYHEYATDEFPGLKACARIFDIDPKAIEKEVRAEVKRKAEKKASKAVKAAAEDPKEEEG